MWPEPNRQAKGRGREGQASQITAKQ